MDVVDIGDGGEVGDRVTAVQGGSSASRSVIEPSTVSTDGQDRCARETA